MPLLNYQSDGIIHGLMFIMGYVVLCRFLTLNAVGNCLKFSFVSGKEGKICSWEKQINCFFLIKLLVTSIQICVCAADTLPVVCMISLEQPSILLTGLFTLYLACVQTPFTVKDRNHKIWGASLEIYYCLLLCTQELLYFQ